MSHAAFHTALVVEPRPLARRSLQQLLRRVGVTRVLEADSAPDALMVLGAELVQLVLTPWALPGLEGRALLQSLRQRGQNRDVPVIVLDDGLSQGQVIAAVKAGMAGRLPAGADEAALRTLLDRIAAERAGGPPGAEADPEAQHAREP